MKYILTITLALFISSNVIADDELYMEDAKEMATAVYVSKFYLSNGKYGYNLFAGAYPRGQLEAKASELCGTKGYVLIREETIDRARRQIIQCNE